MQYRRMGASGLRVSAVSIGGWLTFGGSVEERTALEVLGAALDVGINFVDLADVYARGRAEEVAGRALREVGRSDVVVSSKVFGKMGEGPNDRGLSRKHIFESVERSLRNLGTDYLDLYFCHREDADTPLEETVCAMDDLVRQGKVLYWGTSVWSPVSLRRAHEIAERRIAYAPRVEQPPYNLLQRGIEREVLPIAEALGMGVVVFSPLAGGFLTGKYNDGLPPGSRGAQTDWLRDHLKPETIDRCRVFTGIARELEVEPGQLALAWILRRPEITSAITGATSPEQLRSNAAAVELELPSEVVTRLDELFPA